ncbi:MAG: glycosyltransferase [Terriglobales bacterium]
MKPANILLISPFFYPDAISTGKYNSVLVQALVDRGATVKVVCSHPFYPAWRPVRSADRLDNVDIHRAGAGVRYPRSMILRRLVLEGWFAWHAGWTTWRLRSGCSTAVPVFPPTLFFLIVTSLLPASVKKIGVVHDLQGVLGLSGGSWLNRALYRVVHAVEKKAFQSCDSLIVLSRGMAARIVDEYALPSDRVVVRYPFVTVRSAIRIGTKLADKFPEGFQHVVYSGALGKKQNPYGLLDFFRAAVSQFPGVHFHLFSDGPIFEQLRKRHLACPEDRISFDGLVSEADLEELYARSNVQLIPQLEDTSEACLPSKLPNILAMGCAVLAICPSETELANILQQTACGITADSWDLDVLIPKLRQVLGQAKSQSPQQRQALAAPLLETEFSLEPLIDTVLAQYAPARPPLSFSAAGPMRNDSSL